jgi:hypothetical protein
VFCVLCFVFCVLCFVLIFVGVFYWGWWVFCFVCACFFFVHIVFKGSGVFGSDDDEMDNNLVLSTRNRVPLC